MAELRLTDTMPYPSVRVQPGDEVKVVISYGSAAMLYPKITGTSACLRDAVRREDGSVTATIVAIHAGRVRIRSAPGRATDAKMPVFGGTIVVAGGS